MNQWPTPFLDHICPTSMSCIHHPLNSMSAWHSSADATVKTPLRVPRRYRPSLLLAPQADVHLACRTLHGLPHLAVCLAGRMPSCPERPVRLEQVDAQAGSNLWACGKAALRPPFLQPSTQGMNTPLETKLGFKISPESQGCERGPFPAPTSCAELPPRPHALTGAWAGTFSLVRAQQ
jgi:hypothetical protein